MGPMESQGPSKRNQEAQIERDDMRIETEARAERRCYAAGVEDLGQSPEPS